MTILCSYTMRLPGHIAAVMPVVLCYKFVITDTAQSHP